ncbi:MAG: tyrosyl-tRNA synthetase [Myxococcota bacterium]|jgi:tyrosyl-tRNA synthetase
MTRTTLDVLEERGFIADCSDTDGLAEGLAAGGLRFYVGFDPTATSLHVGNLVGMMAMAWLQRDGHRPYALSGGATGRIGDPSFNDDERPLLTDEQVDVNLAGIRRDLNLVLDLGAHGEDDPARGKLVDNYDWFSSFNVLDFLRVVGKHVSVNQLIARENVRRRLEDREQGISYAEFSYGLIQGFDFAHLYENEGVTLQLGGSDQWGNIVAGVDLARKIYGGKTFALTWPLVEGSDGKKFSKSAGNAPWLNPAETTPFEYFQWWFNTDDRDVERFLKLFTFLPLDEVASVVDAHAADPSARTGQRRLAEEATRIIHGDEGVGRAAAVTGVLFGGAAVKELDAESLQMAFAQAPSADVARSELAGDGMGLLQLLVAVGAAKSNGEARRLIKQGGVRVGDDKVEAEDATVTESDLLAGDAVVLRVGKKRQFVARFG